MYERERRTRNIPRTKLGTEAQFLYPVAINESFYVNENHPSPRDSSTSTRKRSNRRNLTRKVIGRTLLVPPTGTQPSLQKFGLLMRKLPFSKCGKSEGEEKKRKNKARYARACRIPRGRSPNGTEGNVRTKSCLEGERERKMGEKQRCVGERRRRRGRSEKEEKK